jgi:aspartate racemase
MDHIERGDWPAIAELILSSARKLAQIGADFLICPDNTIHQALQYVEQASPLPWLHIAEAVSASAQERGFRKLGLTGTKWLIASDVYPEKLRTRGIEYLRPSINDCEQINRIIMDELVYGILTPDSVAVFQRIISDMKTEGCDAVVLGCTEIPLLINDANSSLPVLNSTRLLACAALQRAVATR